MFGICLCVIFDCALIALICVALHLEDGDLTEQEAEEFASFESVHEARMREAETQTSENTVHCVEKGVQTGSAGEEQSPEEIQAARFDQHRQSEC